MLILYWKNFFTPTAHMEVLGSYRLCMKIKPHFSVFHLKIVPVASLFVWPLTATNSTIWLSIFISGLCIIGAYIIFKKARQKGIVSGKKSLVLPHQDTRNSR